MISELDKAYIAGLFDGEGYVGVIYVKASKNGKRYARLSIAITQNDRSVLDWVAESVGFGKVHYSQKTPNGESYKYMANYRQAEKLLNLIRPYTKVKSNAIDAALQITYGMPSSASLIG